MSTWMLAFAALAGLCLIFTAVFFLARSLDNYGTVDIAWSYAFGALAAFYALAGGGWFPRRTLLAGMAVAWSARLGTHLWRRVASHHPVEDGRYRQLRRDWGENLVPKMFGFFQLQAASVVLLGIAFLLPMRNARPEFSSLEFAGLFLWLIAVAGEALSDAQLATFVRNPAHRGRVCDVGLWRYSRHPNYFFEWLVWVAYLVFALGSPHGWLAVIGPLSILYLLLRVTGIPLTEAQSLRSKGDAYRRYQQRTSAFIPLPRRST